MRKRIPYLICFLALIVVEIYIALFVRDDFIRPYIGDALVTVLLCCFVRCISPYRPKMLAIYIFIFSVAVELLQLIGVANILNIKNAAIRIILGSTFDSKDVLCYFLGCATFFTVETLSCYLRAKK